MDSGCAQEVRHGQNEPGLLFHGKRHPTEMGAPEITRFLTSLAVDGRVAASTQNQALAALLFLYRSVLVLDVPWLDDLVHAKRPVHLPVVLTRDETAAVLRELSGITRLMASLLYGAGLRLLECPRKYPQAGREPGWQWVFPATRFYVDRETGQRRRHHLHESVLQRAVRTAALRSRIAKPVSCHTFRHSFATHLLEDHHDIRTVRALFGTRT
jgi:site-specific recombinase XerD